MLKRDFNSDSVIYDRHSDMTEYITRLVNPNWTLVNEQSYKVEGKGPTIRAQWKETVDEDETICSRFSPVGAFILAYAHELIDDAIEKLFGEARRDGKTVTAQPINGDTDSIMIHASYLLNKEGKPKLNLHTSELGAFNDDTKKYYGSPSLIRYSEVTGLPLFSKILVMGNARKKMYAQKIITPKGDIITVDSKHGGISKVFSNRVMNG